MPRNGVTPPEGYVSRTQLGKELKCTHTAVCNAIKSGIIPESAIIQVGKHSFLHREQAKKAWALNGAFAGRGNYNAELHDRLAKDAGLPAVATETKVTSVRLKEGIAMMDYKLKEIHLKKEQGAVVDRESVDRALFAAGDEIKQALLAMPARIVDELIAMRGDRHGAINLMEDNIRQILMKLADAKQQINQVMNNDKRK